MKLKLMTRLLLLAGLVIGFVPVAQAFYNPSTGRWLSRDPIEERGGRNLHGFAENNPANRWDVLGRIGEGGEWPPPPNNIDPPPSGPFTKCRIALNCGDVDRSGVTLGTHWIPEQRA